MSQERLVEEDFSDIYFYYSEIQSDGIREWVFDQEGKIRNIREVVDGLERQTATHTLEELTLDDNPKMYIKNLLRDYPNYNEDFPAMLINDFGDSMQTRAREAGKYAILMVYEDSVLVCHTDSEELTISKDKEVIERLLDTDNVDKYVRFEATDDGILAHHFERSLSKSFSKWLGISPREVAYEEAGDIQIYSEIEDSSVRFEFEQDEFEAKFVEGEDYELVPGVLRMPNDEYPVSHVFLGRRRFDTVDEFFQEYYTLYYDLEHQRSQYEDIGESMTPYWSTVIDHEDRVTKGPEGETLAVKRNSGLQTIFADKNIQLSASWRTELAKDFENGETVRLCHVKMSPTEDSTKIGPFEIYNDIDVDADGLNSIYEIAQEVGTGVSLTNTIYCVIFHMLSSWTPSPISHFFRQMAEKYEGLLDAEGMIVRDEDRVIEYKSRDWVAEADNEAIAEKITGEIQEDVKLLLIGIEEDEQRIRGVKRSNFDSERNQDIQDKVRKLNGNHNSINLLALPLGHGECILTVFSVRGDRELDLGVIS